MIQRFSIQKVVYCLVVINKWNTKINDLKSLFDKIINDLKTHKQKLYNILGNSLFLYTKL